MDVLQAPLGSPGPVPESLLSPQAGFAFAQLSASVSEVAPASWETTSCEPEGPRRGCGWWFLSMHKAKISDVAMRLATSSVDGWHAQPPVRRGENTLDGFILDSWCHVSGRGAVSVWLGFQSPISL